MQIDHIFGCIRIIMVLTFGLALANISPGRSWATEVLITPQESAYPDSPDANLAVRGAPTSGPDIQQILPSPNAVSANSPLPFKIQFISHDSAIDPNSFRLYYLKSPLVDLTDRVKAHLSMEGINMQAAEVPAGTHILRLHLKDNRGRLSVKLIKFTVNPK